MEIPVCTLVLGNYGLGAMLDLSEPSCEPHGFLLIITVWMGLCDENNLGRKLDLRTNEEDSGFFSLLVGKGLLV